MCETEEQFQPPLDSWSKIIDLLQLDQTCKKIAVQRIAAQASRLRRKVTFLLWAYGFTKTMVTSGALLVPALSGLDGSHVRSETTFWLIWCFSLATAASNAIISLFSLDRKYFTLKERLSCLESEAWLFLALTGKYHTGKTHQELFPSFLENCEHLLKSFSDHSNRSHRKNFSFSEKREEPIDNTKDDWVGQLERSSC